MKKKIPYMHYMHTSVTWNSCWHITLNSSKILLHKFTFVLFLFWILYIYKKHICYCSHVPQVVCPHSFGHEMNLLPLSKANLCHLLCRYTTAQQQTQQRADPLFNPHSGKITLTACAADTNISSPRHTSELKMRHFSPSYLRVFPLLFSGGIQRSCFSAVRITATFPAAQSQYKICFC